MTNTIINEVIKFIFSILIILFSTQILNNGIMIKRNNLKYKYSFINYQRFYFDFVTFTAFTLFSVYLFKDLVFDKYFYYIVGIGIVLNILYKIMSKSLNDKSFYNKNRNWLILLFFYLVIGKQIYDISFGLRPVYDYLLLGIQLLFLVEFLVRNFVSLYVKENDIKIFKIVTKSKMEYEAIDIYEDKDKYIIILKNSTNLIRECQIVNKNEVEIITYQSHI